MIIRHEPGPPSKKGAIMGFDIGKDKIDDAVDKGKDAVNDKAGKDVVSDENADKAKDALGDKFGN